jgi:hypothetical protein
LNKNTKMTKHRTLVARCIIEKCWFLSDALLSAWFKVSYFYYCYWLNLCQKVPSRYYWVTVSSRVSLGSYIAIQTNFILCFRATLSTKCFCLWSTIRQICTIPTKMYNIIFGRQVYNIIIF